LAACRGAGWLAAAVVLSQAAWAQMPAARLASIFPAGAKQGTTLEVTITGADLELASKLHFTHAGITAVPKTRDPNTFEKGPQPVPNQFVVTVAPEVPQGVYEVRAASKFGLSNPRLFAVGTRPELIEKEGNNAFEQATEITVESVVNGQANGGTDVDYFKFQAAAGQRIIIDCQARRLDSRMDATLALYDQRGQQLDSDRDTNGRDPLIDFTAPADGIYYLRVYDFVYGGGGDYVYRIALSTGPYIDFILPPAGQPGTRQQFTLYGRNLPGGAPAEVAIAGKQLQKLAVEIDVPGGPAAEQLTAKSLIVEPEGAGLDGFEYQFVSPQGVSNPVLIGYAAGPIVLEQEPNNDPAAPQAVTLPCEFVGRFEKPRDIDSVSFEAKANQTYWLEIIAQRFGVPTDPYFIVQRVVKDDKGNVSVSDIREADDTQPNVGGIQFNTSSGDPGLAVTFPADGTYRILLRDLYNRGEPRYVYRLTIRPARPDFRLAAGPSFPNNQNITNTWSTLLRKGGAEMLQVYLFRREGFDGEVTVSAEGLPQGVSSAPVTIGPGMNSAPLVLVAAEDAPEWAGSIRIVGKAKIGDAEVTREARGASVVFPAPQQNLTAYARMTNDIALAISKNEVDFFVATIGEGKPLEMSRAGKLEIPVKMVRRNNFKGNVQFNVIGQPQNLQVQNFALNGDQVDGKLVINIPTNVPLGTFTFYMQGVTQVPYARNADLAAAAEEAKKEIEKIAADMAAAAKKAADDAKAAGDAKVAADKAAAEAAAAAQKAAEALKQAKAKADAEQGNQAAQDAKAAAEKAAAEADKAAADAAAKAKEAAEAKAAADKAAAEADARSKAAEQEKQARTKTATDLANAAKPNNINVFAPSTTITLKITAAPISVAPLAAATLKQGGKIEVPVDITRLYGHNEQVTLELQTPGVQGLKVTNAPIPAGQAQAKITLEAAANASVGTFRLPLRLTVPFNGQNIQVTQELPLTIEKGA
jgi:hypothetical protein